MKLLLSALAVSVLLVQGCNMNDEAAAGAAEQSKASGAASAGTGALTEAGALAGAGVSAKAVGANGEHRFYRNYSVSVDSYCDALLNAQAATNRDLGINLLQDQLKLNLDHVALILDNANSRLADTVGISLPFLAGFLNNNYGFADDATLQRLFNLDTKTLNLLDREDMPIDDKLYNALKMHGYRLFLGNEEIVKPPKGPKYASGLEYNFSVLPPDNVKYVVAVTFPDSKGPKELKRDITLNFILSGKEMLTFDNIASVTMQSVYQRAEGEDISAVMSNKGFGGCKVSRYAAGNRPDLKQYLFKDQFALTSKTIQVKGNNAVVFGLSRTDKVLDL